MKKLSISNFPIRLKNKNCFHLVGGKLEEENITKLGRVFLVLNNLLFDADYNVLNHACLIVFINPQNISCDFYRRDGSLSISFFKFPFGR